MINNRVVIRVQPPCLDFSDKNASREKTMPRSEFGFCPVHRLELPTALVSSEVILMQRRKGAEIF
jgi:hypothetical protein